MKEIKASLETLMYDVANVKQKMNLTCEQLQSTDTEAVEAEEASRHEAMIQRALLDYLEAKRMSVEIDIGAHKRDSSMARNEAGIVASREITKLHFENNSL